MSWTTMDISETAGRIRQIIVNAKTASQAHAELMRAYRITGEAQRAELFGVVAAELIAHAFAGEAIRDGNLSTARQHGPGNA